jgi:hypothetical protein
MKIPADKIKHLQGGAVVALAMLAVVAIAVYVSRPLAVAAGSLATAIGIELYQRWRQEGEPSWPDAVASALPGLVAAGALWAAGM